MALCLLWPLESIGTPVSTLMACSTTTRMLTDSALSTGVTRLAALLQPLISPPKVPIADFAFKLATSTECQLWHGINLVGNCLKVMMLHVVPYLHSPLLCLSNAFLPVLRDTF